MYVYYMLRLHVFNYMLALKGLALKTAAEICISTDIFCTFSHSIALKREISKLKLRAEHYKT